MSVRLPSPEDLSDLTIQERAALGEQIASVSERVVNDPDAEPLLYAAVRLRKPLLFIGKSTPPSATSSNVRASASG